MTATIKRRFLMVGNRRVHYFRAGDGPPAVLVHSSPANARLLIDEIERLSADHSIFAFDTPGFGLSDPLPGETLTVADLADALAETLAAIAMPRCPLYGTHTGAAIGLEFGVRHPERVTGLVLDGVPAFTDEECERFFGRYFQKMPPSELGGHYAEAWTRFRDQSIWFPWTNKTPGQLNADDLASPERTHLWVSMFFEAAEHYAPAYRAASYYGAGALRAVAVLDVPAAFCATENDMLYPHLARFPPLGTNQEIVRIGASVERKRDLIAARFAAYGADGPAPADRDAIGSSATVARQFVDAGAGQLHLRHAGDRAAPPLLLIHDAPGSSEQAEPLIAALAQRFFVIAPDLPGCGESTAFEAPTIDAFTAALAALPGRLSLGAVTGYGIGFGASIALALAAGHPDQVATLAVQGLPLPDAVERADWRAQYAPPIAVKDDGAHWYRTWLMLRDGQVCGPWYERTLAAQRRVPADLSAHRLHRWTMDVMRARPSYSDPVAAALAVDPAAALAEFGGPFIQVLDPQTPSAAHDERLARHRAPDATIAAGDGLAEALMKVVMR